MVKARRLELVRFMGALLAGFVGGHIYPTSVPAVAAESTLLRAQRIEITDPSGKTVAYLASTNGQDSALRFLDQKGREIAALGVRSGGSPFLNMLGSDSKVRLTLQLQGPEARPLLGMSDSKWEGRVMLGFIQPDAPSSSDDDWGLLFRAPQGSTNMASLAMIRDARSGRISAKLALLDENGKLWVAPR